MSVRQVEQNDKYLGLTRKGFYHLSSSWSIRDDKMMSNFSDDKYPRHRRQQKNSCRKVKGNVLSQSLSGQVEVPELCHASFGLQI